MIEYLSWLYADFPTRLDLAIIFGCTTLVLAWWAFLKSHYSRA